MVAVLLLFHLVVTPTGNAYPANGNSLDGDSVRLIAAYDQTKIFLNNQWLANINQGEFYEINVDTPTTLTTSRPVQVIQYMKGFTASRVYFGANEGDPSMVVVPPAAQYSRTHFVNTFDYDETGKNNAGIRNAYALHFINIITPTVGVGRIKLNGELIPAEKFFPIANSHYSAAIVDIKSGNHNLEGDFPFMTTAYGLGEYESYAFVGGLQTRKINEYEDPFPPNVRVVRIGNEIRGLATDSSDVNANGIADPEEAIWGAGIVPRSEDTNRNDVLDAGEDLNGNAKIDKDLGLATIELSPSSQNLTLIVDAFTPGALVANFSIKRIDENKDGFGEVIATDLWGNTTRKTSALSTQNLSEMRE